MLSGFGSWSTEREERREIRQTQVEPVGPSKLSKRGWSDGLAEVGLADSTLRQGACYMGKRPAGVDGVTVQRAKEDFGVWVEEMLWSVHRKGYKAPEVRRVWIPKPGKTDKRPLGVPCVADRALQRSTAVVLSSIYEQDFLSCSFPGGSAK